MDSLTHIVIGGITGEITLGKKIGNRALVWGGLIGSIPDFDVFISPFLNPVNALFFHRGISHSLIAALVIIPILGWILSRVEKQRGIEIKHWISLAAFPWLMHLFADYFNTYGTGFLEPINRIRFSFDSMAIIDIFVLIPLTIILVLIALFSYQRRQRRILAWVGIAFFFIYVTFSIFNKKAIESQVKLQLQSQNIKYERFITTPVPLSNFFWGIVAENDSGYYMGNISNFNKKKSIDFYFTPRNSGLLNGFKESNSVESLLRFTKGFYSVESDSANNIWVHDLRYASLDFKSKNAYVFSFEIEKTKNGVEVSRSHPIRKINYKTIRKYSKKEILLK